MKLLSRSLLAAFILTCSLSNAQDRVDSLKTKLSITVRIEEKIPILNNLSAELLDFDPEQALVYATECNSLLSISYDLNEDATNKHNLSLTHQRLGNYQQSIDWSEQGIRNLEENNKSGSYYELQKHLAQHNRDIGSTYRRMGAYTKALSYNQQAEVIYDSLITLYPDDKELLHHQSRTLMAIGIVHSSTSNYNFGTHYYLKALNMAESNQLLTDATYINFNLASQLLNRKNYDSALIYLERVRFLIDSLDIQRLKPYVYQNMGVAFRELGRYDESERSIRQALDIVKDRGLVEEIAHINGVLATVLFETGKLEEADASIREGLKYSDEDMHALQSLYQIQWKLFEKRGEYKQALAAFKKFRILEDSAISMERDRRYANLEARYQNEKKEKELAQNAREIWQLESESQERKLWTYALSIVLVAWIAFAWIIISNQRKRIKVARELNLAKTENARLREKELKQELELKNKELTSYTVNFIQKNELLEELKSILDNMLSNGRADTSTELKRLRRMITQNANLDKYWEDFKVHFDNVHKDFFKNLKTNHPELTGNDLKLCALAKLNLNLKESSLILGISPESVKIARYRLRKKLKLDQEVPLMDYLLVIIRSNLKKSCEKLYHRPACPLDRRGFTKEEFHSSHPSSSRKGSPDRQGFSGRKKEPETHSASGLFNQLWNIALKYLSGLYKLI